MGGRAVKRNETNETKRNEDEKRKEKQKGARKHCDLY